MATQSQGIQQLLAAERRAAEKTAEARKRKNRRMKQAKDEAMVEIEKYKAEREAAYKEKEAKQLGSKEGIQAKIEEDTQVKIAAMTRSVEEGKGEVIASLIEFVCDIKVDSKYSNVSTFLCFSLKCTRTTVHMIRS